MEEIISGILQLKEKSLYALTFDYTYWDEMVAFVLNPTDPQGIQWAQENIQGSLTTFGVQHAWVMSLGHKEVYQTHDDKSLAMPFPVSVAELEKLFQNTHFEHFFVWVDKDLLEVRGATIHPSSDIERKTPAQGYFFAARLWNKDMMDELASLLRSELSIGFPAAFSAERLKVAGAEGIDKMYFFRELKGPGNQPVAILRIEKPFLLGDYMEKFSAGYRKVFLSGAFIFIVIFFLFGFFWISRPLIKISQALSTEDSTTLQQMSQSHSEFGSLSQLIIRFFKQKEKLLKEIIERRRTQRKLREAQTQLLQSEKMVAVGQLSSGIAHEIKNPLANILLAVDCLRQEIPSANISANRQIDIIRKSAIRTNNIITELLNFAREKRISIERKSLNETVEEAIRLADQYFRTKKITLERYYYREKKIVISIDPLLVEQALINLFSNAVDAIDDKGTISIRTSVRENTQNNKLFAILEIADTGKGMTPEIQKKIFNPFFTTKEIGFGTGLGLSNAYMIFRRHEADIEVKSEPGQGTTFTITFPCRTEQA